MAASTSESRPDPLGLTEGEMRELAHLVADLAVDHALAKVDGPAMREASPQVLREILGGPPPEKGTDPRTALNDLVDVGLVHMQHGDHPRYFARVPSPASFIAVMGDWMATAYNAIATSWAGGSGPSTIELVANEWLRQALGLAEGTEGILTSGGSLGNLVALRAAWASGGPGIVYLTDQTHASIARDLHALGIEPEDLVEIPTDAIHGMDIDALRERIRSDRNNGRRPAIVIGSAGTTNTGAVDPLNDLADIAAAKGMWLHVDGAYGAPAAMTERGRQRLQGLERADSLVLDPHKWLFQPYDIGCVFVRRPAVLEETFSMHPSYLIDTTAREGEVDLRDRGLELTRRARGVKLWLTLKVHGLAAIRRAIEAGLDLAEDAQRILERDPAWEVVTPAQLAIVTFARRGASAEHHRVAAATLSADGYAAVTCTKFDGRTVLRLCTLNPATTSGDLAETIRRLATLVEGLSAGPSPTVP